MGEQEAAIARGKSIPPETKSDRSHFLIVRRAREIVVYIGLCALRVDFLVWPIWRKHFEQSSKFGSSRTRSLLERFGEKL
jgi:hypothetical protein